ncbi:MAG: glycosyltransferase 87 family protein [Terracidiphilus sp.]|jgi:hypothetical protein
MLAKITRVVGKLLLATLCGLAFGFTVWCFLFSMTSDKVVGSRDFALYWTTGQQIVHHGNPYDGDALLRIARGAGMAGLYGTYMCNPPWTLPLVYPLGFMGLRVASILWSLFMLVCLVGSVHMVWVMQGRPAGRRQLLGYSFGPALICLIMGQIALLALVGLVLFLRFHRTRPFLAGVSLWLCMLKPHLFLAFGVVLLVWIVFSKSYKILLGAAAAVVASCALAYLIVPFEWSQYLQVLRRPGNEWEYIPCLSVLLRLWVKKDAAWVQYLPSVIGCVWGLGYFWPRRLKWDWLRQGSLLMLVSIVSAPYSWLYDQALAIPALLQGAFVTSSRSMLATLAFLSALIEVGLFGIVWKPATLYLWTLWSSPAWLVWYLYAVSRPAERVPGQVPAQAGSSEPVAP